MNAVQMVIGYLAEVFSIPSLDFMLNEKELIGCRGSTKKELQQVGELVDMKRLKPMIGATVPLEQFDRAVERLEQGDIVGRIVLTR